MRDQNIRFLNKENLKLYESLKGEYKIYAWQLLNALFTHCKPRNAINRSLYDAFSMLYEAQTTGRPFSEIVPDPRAWIKETVLCFPAKKMSRRTLISLIAATAIVLLTAILTATLTPIQLDEPDLSFDDARMTLSWQQVPHAESYQISVDGETIATTDKNSFTLPETYNNHRTLYFSVTALGEGRYQPTVGTHFYKKTESLYEDFDIEDLFGEGCETEISFPSGLYEEISLTIKPSYDLHPYNLCIVMEGDILSFTDSDWNPIDTSKVCILQSKNSYYLTMKSVAAKDADKVSVRIRLLNPLSFAASENPILPAGETLFIIDEDANAPSFGAPYVPASDRAWCTTQTAEHFLFTYENNLSLAVETKQNTFYLGIEQDFNSPPTFLIAHNQAYKDTLFLPRESLVTVSEGDSVTLTLPVGWTTFYVEDVYKPIPPYYMAFCYFLLWQYRPYDSSTTIRASYLYDEGSYFTYTDSLTPFRSFSNNENTFCFLYEIATWTPYNLYAHRFYSVYCDKPTEFSYEIFIPYYIPKFTETDLENGEIVLSPGINYISWDLTADSEAAIQLSSDTQYFYVADSSSWGDGKGTENNKIDYNNYFIISNGETWESIIIINPYEEPLTLKLSLYRKA